MKSYFLHTPYLLHSSHDYSVMISKLLRTLIKWLKKWHIGLLMQYLVHLYIRQFYWYVFVCFLSCIFFSICHNILCSLYGINFLNKSFFIQNVMINLIPILVNKMVYSTQLKWKLMVFYHPAGRIHSAYKPEESADAGKSTVKWWT